MVTEDMPRHTSTVNCPLTFPGIYDDYHRVGLSIERGKERGKTRISERFSRLGAQRTTSGRICQAPPTPSFFNFIVTEYNEAKNIQRVNPFELEERL
ncbi:hypothetical protein MJO29_006497 [Puccinia striiformis f. sp. tritici]|nr:hypothetical protein MJO29_006497 [Puccinia striiformis f. sp. tritici]